MALISAAPVGPSFVSHVVGKFKKSGTESPPEFKPSVTVVIPAENEMRSILYSLA